MRLLLASAVLAALVACGGDDPSPASSPTPTDPVPTASPTPLTKAEYVTAVDRICDRVNEDAEEIAEPKTAEEYLQAANQIIALIEDAQGEARALIPPPEDAAALEANFLSVNDRQLAAFKAARPELQSAAQSKDLAAAEKAFGDAAAAGESTDAQDQFLTGYGLGSCVG